MRYILDEEFSPTLPTRFFSDIDRLLISRDGSRVTAGAPSFHCRLMITPASISSTPIPPAIVPTIALSAHSQMSQHEQNMVTTQNETCEVDRNSLSLDHRDGGSPSGSSSRKEVYGPGDDSQAKPSGSTNDPDLYKDEPAKGDTMKDLVDTTNSKIEHLGAESPFLKHIAGIGDAVDSTTNVAGSATSIWGPVIDNVRVFMDVADTIAEVHISSIALPRPALIVRIMQIHPYAKAAWSFISVVPKVSAPR